MRACTIAFALFLGCGGQIEPPNDAESDVIIHADSFVLDAEPDDAFLGDTAGNDATNDPCPNVCALTASTTCPTETAQCLCPVMPVPVGCTFSFSSTPPPMNTFCCVKDN